MKKRVNAGLKSPAELAQRLQDGEVFWIDGDEIHFEGSQACPFRYESEDLRGAWTDYADMEIEREVEWWERASLENPVLCWAWDGHHDCRYPALICERDDKGNFLQTKLDASAQTMEGYYKWDQATPMTEEELTRFSLHARADNG